MSATFNNLDRRCPRVQYGSDSYYYENYFTAEQADALYQGVQEEFDGHYVPRNSPLLQFKIFGKVMQLPRDKIFQGTVVGDEAPQYRYNAGSTVLYPTVKPFTPTTLKIRDILHAQQQQDVNHLVGNRYLSKMDHIGFHHDKTRDFAPGSSVLTMSFGASRLFELQHVETKRKEKIILTHGSLFVLGPLTNAEYKHSIVKTNQPCGVRISLTYRSIKRYINRTTGLEVPAPLPPVAVPASELVHRLESPGPIVKGFVSMLQWIARFALDRRDQPLSMEDASHNFGPLEVQKLGRVLRRVRRNEKTVLSSDGEELYLPKDVAGGNVFCEADNDCREGMIRLYERRGGSPKYRFWFEADGTFRIGMA